MSKIGNENRFGTNYADGNDDLMLSELGRSRRDALLVELQGAVVGEGRRRRVRRNVMRSASLAMVMIGVGVTFVATRPAVHAPVVLTVSNKTEKNEFISRIQIMQTRPEAVAAMIAHPAGDLSHYYVNDRELVDTLSSIGRPSGLIRKDGVVRLAVAVTDPISELR